MSSEPFLALAARGRAFLDDIDDYVDRWHEESSASSLWEYLGMSHEDYKIWLEKPEYLPFLVKAKRNQEPIETLLVNHSQQVRIAARGAEGPEEAAQVLAWLRQTGRIE
jgi:hypothetical protein